MAARILGMAQHAPTPLPTRRRRSSDPSLARLVESFLDRLAAGGASANTLAAYRRDLVGVAGRLAAARELGDVAGLRLSQVDSEALEAGMAEWASDHAPASVARAWSAWSSLFTFLMSRGLARANPTEAAERPVAPSPVPRVIAGGDVSERMLSAAAMPEPAARSAWAERDVALVATMGLTGLGISELLSLSLGSVRRDASGEPFLLAGRAGEERAVAVAPGLAELIGAYLESREAWLGAESPDAPLFVDASGQPMTASKVQYLVQRLYERSGLSGEVPEGAAVHALHATFVAEALARWAEVLRASLSPPPPGRRDPARRSLESDGR